MHCSVSQLLTRAETEPGCPPARQGSKRALGRRRKTAIGLCDEAEPLQLRTKLRERLESTELMTENLKARCLERLDDIAEASSDRLPADLRESTLADVAAAKGSVAKDWRTSSPKERTPTSSAGSRSLSLPEGAFVGSGAQAPARMEQEAMSFRLGLANIKDLSCVTYSTSSPSNAASLVNTQLSIDRELDRDYLDVGVAQLPLGVESTMAAANADGADAASEFGGSPRRKPPDGTVSFPITTASNWLTGKSSGRLRPLQRANSESSTLHRQHWDIFWLEPVREEEMYPPLGKWRQSTSPLGSWSPRGQKMSILLSANEAKRVTAKAKAHDIPLATPSTPDTQAFEWRMRSLRNSSLSRAMKP